MEVVADEFCSEVWDGGEIAGYDSGEESGDGGGAERSVGVGDEFGVRKAAD